MTSAASGKIFALVQTVQLDVALGDDSFALRIELFQDSANKEGFRAGIWRTDFYRIQSTFPQDSSTGRPEHEPSDEVILVDWSTNLAGDYSAFKADTADLALDAVLRDIRATLDRISGVGAA